LIAENNMMMFESDEKKSYGDGHVLLLSRTNSRMSQAYVKRNESYWYSHAIDHSELFKMKNISIYPSLKSASETGTYFILNRIPPKLNEFMLKDICLGHRTPTMADLVLNIETQIIRRNPWVKLPVRNISISNGVDINTWYSESYTGLDKAFHATAEDLYNAGMESKHHINELLRAFNVTYYRKYEEKFCSICEYQRRSRPISRQCCRKSYSSNFQQKFIKKTVMKYEKEYNTYQIEELIQFPCLYSFYDEYVKLSYDVNFAFSSIINSSLNTSASFWVLAPHCP